MSHLSTVSTFSSTHRMLNLIVSKLCFRARWALPTSTFLKNSVTCKNKKQYFVTIYSTQYCKIWSTRKLFFFSQKYFLFRYFFNKWKFIMTENWKPWKRFEIVRNFWSFLRMCIEFRRNVEKNGDNKFLFESFDDYFLYWPPDNRTRLKSPILLRKSNHRRSEIRCQIYREALTNKPSCVSRQEICLHCYVPPTKWHLQCPGIWRLRAPENGEDNAAVAKDPSLHPLHSALFSFH